MAVITAIDRKGRSRRAEVRLAEGAVLSLSLDLIAERGLAVGIELSEEERLGLLAEDAKREAVARALRLLAVQPRSERDLRQRLRRRGLPREAVDAAVKRMTDLGYLDDAAFARFWVESRQAATPRSSRYLLYELSRRGVTREEAEAAVGGVSDGEAAYEAARRRARGLAGLERQAFRERLLSFLAGRGFSYSTSRAAVERCWEEMEPAY
jgi:regulatory protein